MDIYDKILIVVVIIGAFIIGIGVGNWATREYLKKQQDKLVKMDSVSRYFCSADGKLWFPARADGMCYAIDEPR